MSTSQGIDEMITAAAATLADGLAEASRALARELEGNELASQRPAAVVATALTAGARFLREVAHAVDEVAAGITESAAADDGDEFEQLAAVVSRVLGGRGAGRPVLTVVDDTG
jgi:hypothetical protein